MIGLEKELYVASCSYLCFFRDYQGQCQKSQERKDILQYDMQSSCEPFLLWVLVFLLPFPSYCCLDVWSWHGISCWKDSVEGKGKFLYSFRNQRRASKEEADFLRRNADGYDDSEFRKKQMKFGTVVLECDIDMDKGNL